MNLEYIKYRNYNLPNISVSEESNATKGKHFGKYGLLKLTFLKENRQVLFQELLLNNKLHEHLVKTENYTFENIKNIIIL